MDNVIDGLQPLQERKWPLVLGSMKPPLRQNRKRGAAQPGRQLSRMITSNYIRRQHGSIAPPQQPISLLKNRSPS